MHPDSLIALASSRRTLLLQGPMGPFFHRLAGFLEAHGAHVHKVNFNGGDGVFYRRPAHPYTGTLEDWPQWLEALLASERFDAVALFGQSRPVHRSALTVAQRAGVATFVFEEGYIRPDYVTLERGGVNGLSALPRDPAAYADDGGRSLRVQPTQQGFARMAWYATAYAWATWGMRWRYAHVPYHRELHPVIEAGRWLRSGARKLVYALRQRHVLAELTSPQASKRWFLLPLQVHNDAQVTEHSPFADMVQVMRHVMLSFAIHAPEDHRLVVKHHPMDRAYRHYAEDIRRLAAGYGLAGRVLYVHDLHLPTLLRHARGVVTVNSTTGLQALWHGTPVCALGDAIYAMPGLTHCGPLEDFWSDPPPVDRRLAKRFRRRVIAETQLNASFYGSTPALRPADETADRTPGVRTYEPSTIAAGWTVLE